MTYIKLEDDVFRNPKVVQVGTVAKLIYVASICYSGHHLTDGFVPKNAVRSLCADAGVNYSAKVVKELLSAALWREIPNGYIVHDYLTYNESADKVRAKKEAARQRMERLRSGERSGDVRANNERTSADVRDTTTTTTASPNGEDTPIPPSGNTGATAPESDPPPKRRKRKSTLTAEQQARFNRWYSEYPKKLSPADAEKAWAAIDPDDDLTDRMIAKVQEWADSVEWTKDGRRYCPYPATWLNKGRWRDGSPSERVQPNGSLHILDDPDAPIIPGPRGYTQDQLRRLSQQERRREAS